MREKLLEPRPLKNCPVTVELHYANVGSKKPIFGYIYTISSRLVLVLFNENSSCVVFWWRNWSCSGVWAGCCVIGVVCSNVAAWVLPLGEEWDRVCRDMLQTAALHFPPIPSILSVIFTSSTAPGNWKAKLLHTPSLIFLLGAFSLLRAFLCP